MRSDSIVPKFTTVVKCENRSSGYNGRARLQSTAKARFVTFSIPIGSCRSGNVGALIAADRGKENSANREDSEARSLIPSHLFGKNPRPFLIEWGGVQSRPLTDAGPGLWEGELSVRTM